MDKISIWIKTLDAEGPRLWEDGFGSLKEAKSRVREESFNLEDISLVLIRNDYLDKTYVYELIGSRLDLLGTFSAGHSFKESDSLQDLVDAHGHLGLTASEWMELRSQD